MLQRVLSDKNEDSIVRHEAAEAIGAVGSAVRLFLCLYRSVGYLFSCLYCRKMTAELLGRLAVRLCLFLCLYCTCFYVYIVALKCLFLCVYCSVKMFVFTCIL